MSVGVRSDVVDSLLGVGSGGNAVDFDITMVVMMVIFLGLMVYLNKTLFQPYLDAKDRRHARIDGAKKTAKELQKKADGTFAEYEEALAEAMAEGTAERARLKQDGKAEERQLLVTAREDIEKTLSKARNKLGNEIDEAEVVLDKEAATLSTIIVEKVMG